MKSSLSSKHSDLVGKCVMYCVFLVLIYEILLGQIRFARKIPNYKEDKPRNGVITISHLKEAQNKTNSIIALFCAHFTTRKLQSSFEKAMKKWRTLNFFSLNRKLVYFLFRLLSKNFDCTILKKVTLVNPKFE